MDMYVKYVKEEASICTRLYKMHS